MEALKELVAEEPTLYASKKLEKLSKDCCYFLIEKDDHQGHEYEKQIGILKYLNLLKTSRKISGNTGKSINDLSQDEQAEVREIDTQLSGWYLLDLFYPWHKCYHDGQWDNKVDESNLRDLLEMYHLIEIKHLYTDSSHIYENNCHINTAISEIASLIAKIKRYGK